MTTQRTPRRTPRTPTPRAAPLALLAALALLVPTALAQPLRVLTHDSFAVSESVLDGFTEATGIEVQILQFGDAGEVVNRAVLTKDAPIADVLYGVDDSLLARAAEAGIFEPYVSPALGTVAPEFRLESDLVTPVDAGFVTFNLDRAWFETHDVPVPDDLADLTDDAYRGLVVVPDPATSSPGLAFMLATLDRFGDDWLAYWAALRDNDLQVTGGWSDAYYTAFSLYGGDRPIVLSYASSPAAEVVFAEEPLDASPTMNLLCDRCVYRQIEAAGILAGTARRAEAEAFLDFLLGLPFQEDVPLTMFVYPVVEGAALPEAFERFSQRPSEAQTASIAPERVAADLQAWLEAWTRVVVRGEAP